MRTLQTQLERFGEQHLDGALRLSRQAGWPHRPADWRMALSLSDGVAAVDGDGKVVGTAFVTAFKTDAATINMVIVDEAMRGQGLGRKLMDAAVRLAGNLQLRLVATTEGLPLYEKFGFRKTGSIVQHQGIAGDMPAPPGVEPACLADLPAIIALDRAACGADRERMIVSLAMIGEFVVLRRNGRVEAFAGLRPFGRGEVIGPVVAPSLGDAKALVSHFIARRPGQFLRVDTDAQAGLADWLAGNGLVHVGGGITMARPVLRRATPAVTTFALANQALG